MSIRNLLLVMLMGFVGVTQAQSEVKTFRVHFNSDEYTLDAKDKELLDAVLKETEQPVYCELVLKAHTDKDASNAYNIELSKKRAQSVQAYLQEKGLGKQRLSTYAYGETKPITTNSNENGKAENRRVDIMLHYYAYSDLNGFLKLIGGETKQVYKIKANEDQTLVAKNGLIIKVPKGSFQTADGKEVNAGELQLVVEEFFTPKDAATQQLSTMAEGRLLESGGMFSLQVLQQGKELKVKNGKSLQVEIPTMESKNNMLVFAPMLNDQGVTEWKQTAQPFEVKPKKQVDLPFTKLNAAILQSQKVDISKESLQPIDYLYKPLKVPFKPSFPRKQSNLKMLEREDMFSWYERIFYSGAYMDKKLAMENKRRETINANVQNRYQKRLSDYYAQLEKYRVDSAAFETSELEAFRNWLGQKQVELIKAREIIDKGGFNRGIDKMVEISDQEKLTAINPRAKFLTLCNPNRTQTVYVTNLENAGRRISILKNLSLTEALKFSGNKAGIINLQIKEPVYWSYTPSFGPNQYALTQLNENKNLAKVFDDAQIDIMQKREKLGLLDAKAVDMVYSAAINQFGTYNCDRFSDVPPAQMAKIDIDYEPSAKVSFFVPSINSYIYAYRSGRKGYNLSLPLGKEVKMVVLTYNKKGEPLFETKTFVVTGDQTIEANPQPKSIFDIRNALAAI